MLCMFHNKPTITSVKKNYILKNTETCNWRIFKEMYLCLIIMFTGLQPWINKPNTWHFLHVGCPSTFHYVSSCVLKEEKKDRSVFSHSIILRRHFLYKVFTLRPSCRVMLASQWSWIFNNDISGTVDLIFKWGHIYPKLYYYPWGI